LPRPWWRYQWKGTVLSMKARYPRIADGPSCIYGLALCHNPLQLYHFKPFWTDDIVPLRK
jgi:hypothetical protein